jgi:hypothetical protein
VDKAFSHLLRLQRHQRSLAVEKIWLQTNSS